MKILYGLPSEGMGHATRSKVVIDFLLSKKHDVRIVTSNKAFDFMKKHYGDRVQKIEGFHLAYEKANVSITKTILSNLRRAPGNVIKNFNASAILLNDFLPDLVISDFESFTYFFAKYHHIPYISIDNMQVIDRAKLDIPIPHNMKLAHDLAKTIISVKVPGAKHYYITSFFRPTLHKKNTTFVSPIIRQEIIKAKPSIGNHILVYQTSSSQSDLMSILQQLPKEKFIVYGFNKQKVDGNVSLEKFSETTFIQHLASAKAVIANGGFSLISEALYLQKPICSVPIQQQFEQYVNAAYINKLQYGKCLNTLNADGIKSFLYDLEYFRKEIKQAKINANEDLFVELDVLLNKLSNPTHKKK